MHDTPLIVGIGGSTADDSATTRLLHVALKAAEAHGAATLAYTAERLSFAPYRADAPRTPEIRAFVSDVGRADGLFLVSPTYHGTITGLLKNALDYLEDLRAATPPYMGDKAVGLIAVGAGHQGAATTLGALRTVVHALRGWPTPMGLSLSSRDPLFDAQGRLAEGIVAARLDAIAAQVVRFARSRDSLTARVAAR